MRKRALSIILAASMITALFAGCGSSTGTGKVTEREFLMTAEAEDGVVTTGNTYATLARGVSGTGYVTGFTTAGERATITVDIPEDGHYDLVFSILSTSGSYKENYVYLDGTQLGTVSCESKEFTDAEYNRVYMSAGSHEITLEAYWGYINWDKVDIYKSASLPFNIYEVSAELSNPNASDNAKRLMSYLTDIYGEYILSGQYADGGLGSWEVYRVKENNGGNTPAVIGLEMGHLCQTGVDNDFTHPSVSSAIQVWEQGGIVTMCYHWLAPEKYCTGIWWNGFRAEAVNMPLEKIMNGEDEEGMQLLLNDIKILAEGLQELEDAGVPVLWRPLHEASGGWFWWGESGAEAYKKLYILMYDQLTNVYGLDNLIWVWNGQDEEWYPGDEYVDIIATDIYPGEQEYSSHIADYMELYSWLGDTNKLIALSENGTMPDVEACVRDGAMWSFFCTWEGEFVINDYNDYSEQYTDKEMLYSIYNNEKVLNMEDLPDLTTYKIKNK